ncbi:TPA: hypothetical protein ACH3X2_000203 [Trebouxia sp. C0005]
MPGQPSTALPLRPEPSDVSSGVSSRVAVALLFSVITAATLFSVVVVLVCRKQPPVVSSASLMRRPAQPLHHVSGSASFRVSEVQRIAKEGLQEQGAQPVVAHAVSHLVQPDGSYALAVPQDAHST